MLLIVEMRQANRTKIFVETFPIESIKNAFSVAMATLLGKQQQMQFEGKGYKCIVYRKRLIYASTKHAIHNIQLLFCFSLIIEAPNQQYPFPIS